MKKTIYKFLDWYVGDGVICTKYSDVFGTSSDNYNIKSNKGTLILWFKMNGDYIKIYRSDVLCNTVSNYFALRDIEESWKYVRDWFGDKYGLKKVGDLSKFL